MQTAHFAETSLIWLQKISCKRILIERNILNFIGRAGNIYIITDSTYQV